MVFHLGFSDGLSNGLTNQHDTGVSCYCDLSQEAGAEVTPDMEGLALIAAFVCHVGHVLE